MYDKELIVVLLMIHAPYKKSGEPWLADLPERTEADLKRLHKYIEAEDTYHEFEQTEDVEIVVRM